MPKEKVTPMMKQFFDLKSKHPDALLLFRCGDFYETYDQDAREVSEILGITLTRRNNGRPDFPSTEMAGFPFHALDTYLPRLIRAGRRVAICDQLEDPKKTNKLVKRGITELVTPGVAMQDALLGARENNFLAAVHFGRARCGVAFLDFSTGEFLCAEGGIDLAEKLMATYAPSEVLYEAGKKQMFLGAFGGRYHTFEMGDWAYCEPSPMNALKKHFGVKTLKGFGVDHMQEGLVAAGVVLEYLADTSHTDIGHITRIAPVDDTAFVRLDQTTLRALELVYPISPDGRSLLSVIDRTTTAMGARRLNLWLKQPLKNVQTIRERQDVVDNFFRQPQLRELLLRQAQQIGDLERIIGRVDAGRVSPRDLALLRTALEALPHVKAALEESDDPSLRKIGAGIVLCEELRERIARELLPDPPALTTKGGMICNGVSKELDELRAIAYNGKEYLLHLQQREAQQTGIQSLKVGYNNVFGYYLEVRNTYKDKVPAEWVRKQTLVQAERYITQELKEYEEKIIGAEERIIALETQLFASLVKGVQQYTKEIQADAQLVSELDCLLSFAISAYENKYIRPVVDDSYVIDIKGGRHPVIEHEMAVGERYVPNDVYLDNERQQVIIVTGPNMAGKSALLRQTALICLMAQIGSFVPAEAARIGFVDKIFTRVGASDNVARGESTFMVEMSEAANIINNVSPRSLVIFDELGRGTSTYDGISIAWSIVEYLHENAKAHARTLFATHYHELNEMAATYSRVKNYNVAVREKDGRVVFLRRLEEGGAEHSFGIHVARLAGMPRPITDRADEVLRMLEQTKNSEVSGTITTDKAQDGVQMNFFQLDDPVLSQVRDEILHLDVDNLTPLEALNKLNDIKRIVKGK